MRSSDTRMTFARGLVVALALVVSACSGAEQAVPLGVQGRSNASPWIAASGDFVAVAWGATDRTATDVFVATSRNGGRSFGRPVRVNAVDGEARLGGEFPPRVALTARDGQDPRVVVLWTSIGAATGIKAARSDDGGRTFDAPVTLQAGGVEGDRGWAALALDEQANAHAIWVDHRGLAGSTMKHEKGKPHDGVAMAQKSGVYYASLPSPGASQASDAVQASAVAPSGERRLTNGVCYCCKTALATGPGDTIVAAWRHVYPGSFRDIAVAVSTDGGGSFTEPARVSEDGWEINGCPDDGPAVDVDAGGTVHIAWPTVLAGARPEGALFYASTKDGRTFTPRVRIPTLGSPKPSHVQLVVGPDGRVAVAWDEVVNGRRVAAVREVKPEPDGSATFGEAVTLADEGDALYPVLAVADDRLLAVWTAGGEASKIHVRAVRLP